MGSKTSSRSSATRTSHAHYRRQHKSTDKFLLFLHSSALLLAFFSIGLFTAIIPIWNANFFHSSGLLRGDWPDGLPILPLSIAFLTSAYYLFRLIQARWSANKAGDYLKSRHSARTSHDVSKKPLFLTSITLVLLLTCLILSATSGLFRVWRPAIITSSVQLSSGTATSSVTLSNISLRHVIHSISDNNPTGPGLTPPKSNPTAQNSKASFHFCTLANIFTRKCNPTLFLLGDLQITAISTASLVWLLNFIILVLQIRDHQYQKRKFQRSLRSKARSKLDLIEDEISRAEKGVSSAPKKIHHEKQRGHVKSSSVPLASSAGAPQVTRPVRAHTLSDVREEVEGGIIRPKQHYYNPNITPSRLRSTHEYGNTSATTLCNIEPLVPKGASAHAQQNSRRMGQQDYGTAYSRAVDEARRKVKPAETMRDWLASRA